MRSPNFEKNSSTRIISGRCDWVECDRLILRKTLALGLLVEGVMKLLKNKRVEIYQDVEVLENPTNLSEEDILLGFILNLKRVL